MIEVKNISYAYGRSGVKSGKHFEVKDVSLQLENGYISCLMGKNGAGKTTLLNLIYGMLKPRKGEILWNGSKLDRKTISDYRQQVAYVGETWCSEGLTVEHNIELLALLYPEFDRGYYDRIMKMAGLDHVRQSLFGMLSKGERVKTEIAFALARKPQFLILDEPLANIDPVFKTDILEILRQGVEDHETGILLSTHLLDEISSVVDYIFVMEEGKITKSGSRFELLGEDESILLKDVLKGEH